MGAMPFAQHPAQKHREPACFRTGTFRTKASRAWPASTGHCPDGAAPWARSASSRVYCARFQVTCGVSAKG